MGHAIARYLAPVDDIHRGHPVGSVAPTGKHQRPVTASGTSNPKGPRWYEGGPCLSEVVDQSERPTSRKGVHRDEACAVGHALILAGVSGLELYCLFMKDRLDPEHANLVAYPEGLCEGDPDGKVEATTDGCQRPR